MEVCNTGSISGSYNALPHTRHKQTHGPPRLHRWHPADPRPERSFPLRTPDCWHASTLKADVFNYPANAIDDGSRHFVLAEYLRRNARAGGIVAAMKLPIGQSRSRAARLTTSISAFSCPPIRSANFQTRNTPTNRGPSLLLAMLLVLPRRSWRQVWGRSYRSDQCLHGVIPEAACGYPGSSQALALARSRTMPAAFPG